MVKEKRVCFRQRDLELMLFLSEYGVITNENVKLIYKSDYYYKNRLASLAKGDMIERLYGKVILGTKGKRYLNETGFGYRNINRDEKYKKRLERVSDIACKFKDCGWFFEPSWRCDINTYTKRGNRFVGIVSRRKREYNEDEERFNKTAYIVYFLHKDITQRELKYISKEIERNKRNFKGLIVFTEDEKYLYKPKFNEIQYEESYIIPYDNDIWEVFRKIKEENFMHNQVENIFGDKLVSLRDKSFYDDFYIKEDGIYTYIYYMPFTNFNLMHYINFQATSHLMEGTRAKVVCLENCVEYVRKYLDEKVEVICISVT